KNRIGFRNRYVGFANVFDSYGRCMFFEGTAKTYEKGKTAEQLKDLVEGALEKYKGQKGKYPARVVLHYWKRYGRAERDFVINLIGSVIEDADVAFVSLDDSHPLRLYATSTPDGS